ncbi:HdeD family acid-resistance protein [Pontibacter mangrovi]|uniref:HdeD family acid-resistance protein n=1 Tax=Pontibacter mangrovi TaxID=2589816 RepID=A0A501W195_9BACT|nr:DUF308 domain-containing protein [Pontibacter mangrovi]TPE43389.1 hypothetical protein FJM65_14890 [Pontibacter mangrovi]
MELVFYRHWWLLSLKGAALIILGILAFIYPLSLVIGLALYIGLVLALMGVLTIVAAFANREKSQWGWILAVGLFDVVLGAVLVVFPLQSVMAFAILTGFWAIFTGMLQIVAFFSVRKAHSATWGFMLLTGVLAIVLGMFLIWSPLSGAVAVTYLLGVEALLIGIMSLVYSFRLRKIASPAPGEGPFQLSH